MQTSDETIADIAQLLGCEPGEVRQRVEGLHFALRQIVAMTSPMGTDSGDAGVYRVARAALAELRKPASEPQVLRRPVHACGIEGKTACGLAIENNHTESDPILRGPLHESVTCETCMARSRKAKVMDAEIREQMWHDPNWTCPRCLWTNMGIRTKCRNCGLDSELLSGGSYFPEPQAAPQESETK